MRQAACCGILAAIWLVTPAAQGQPPVLRTTTAGVARMQQERTTYYLLTYQSTNTALDGTFRKVTVRVKRPKVTVRARPGYLAVPAR